KMEYTYLNILGKPFPALNHTKLMAGSKTPTQVTPSEEPSPHEVIESSDSIIENTKSILPFVIFATVILLFIGGYKLISSVVQNEVNSGKTTDLGPKIESSSALVRQPEKPTAAPEATEPQEDKPEEVAET